MKVKFELICNNKIVLPFSHSHILQGLIYNFLEDKAAEWLHSEGFKYEKRSFKMFVFSDIIERAQIDKTKRMFIFPETISFYLASPVDWILQQAAQNLIKSEKVKLGNNICFISSISVLKQELITDNKIRVKTLSPITIHSTFKKPDGKNITHYYSPFEKEFSELISMNLRKKWKSLYKKDYTFDNIVMKPLFDTNRKEKIRYFKKTLIKGWTGMFELTGEPEPLQFALNVGLGDRNSQGYGMVEFIKL
jgi:CRISPR-associated endoribonuclease Cas6